MNKFDCKVEESGWHDGNDMLSVTHNGYQWSSIGLYNRGEVLQIISALQHRLHLTASGVGMLARLGYIVIGCGCRLAKFGGR